MAQFDDYISAVTRRLRPDAELQMDIAHELRTHLEDTAEAAHAGGMDEDASQSEAVRAFGDVDELADKLFEANRRRMRLRAVLKWTARATLLPAALLVTALVVGAATIDLMTSGTLYDLETSGFLSVMLWRTSDVEVIVEDLVPLRSDLSDEEAFIAEHRNWSFKSAEELAARYPTSRRYHALYTRMLFHESDTVRNPRIHAALDRGNIIDPDNAFYDILRAAVLMQSASRLASGSAREARKLAPDYDIEVTDDIVFEAGATALRRAAEKDYVCDYVGDLEKEWQDARARPETLKAQMGLLTHMHYGLLPDLSPFHSLSTMLPQYALMLAKEGRIAEALALLEALERVTIMYGAQAYYVVTALSAQAVLVSALEGRARVLETAGTVDAATAIRERLAVEKSRARNLVDVALQNHASLGNRNSALLTSVGPLPSIDAVLVEQTRRAELSVIVRTALSLMLLVPLLGTMLLSVFAARYLVARSGCDDRPSSFSGWRRPIRIGLRLLAVLAVAVVAWLIWFTAVDPFASLQFPGVYGDAPRLIIILIVFPLGIALLSTVAAMHISLRCTRDDRALLLFIGWKRLARIMLWAVVAPAGGYVVWLCVLPNPLMDYGIAHCMGQLLFDVALLSVVSAGTLLHLGCRAIRARMAEAGMELPEDRFFRPLHGRWGFVRAAALLLLTIICVTTWGPSRATESRFIVMGSCAAALFVGWGLYTLRQFDGLRTDRTASRFCGTFIRSLLPIVLVCLVAAGAVTHITLRWTERRAIRAINQPDYQTLLDETRLHHCGRALREHHRELDRRWRERRRDDAHEQRGE
jgi:hypothetical protein